MAKNNTTQQAQPQEAKEPTRSAFELSLEGKLAPPDNVVHAVRLKWRDPCPKCGQGKMDYNSMLSLECPVCGYQAEGSAGGCT